MILKIESQMAVTSSVEIGAAGLLWVTGLLMSSPSTLTAEAKEARATKKVKLSPNFLFKLNYVGLKSKT